jgi:hypothetical protein
MPRGDKSAYTENQKRQANPLTCRAFDSAK